MYGEDWQKVAEHVGTRTKEQCIIQFLQLPIEDPYLDSQLSELGPFKYSTLPFSQTDNPIISTLSFLASIINPSVASAAAKAALNQFTHNFQNSIDSSSSSSNFKNQSNGNGNGNKIEGDEEKDEEKQEEKEKQEGEKEGGLEGMDISTTEESNSSNNNGNDDNNIGSNNENEVKNKKDKNRKQETIETVTSAALGAAATKAYLLAMTEERTLQKLVIEAVELELKKLEIKLTHFDELEIMLANERKQLEKMRIQLIQERLSLRKSHFGSKQLVAVQPQQPIQQESNPNQTADSSLQTEEPKFLSL